MDRHDDSALFTGSVMQETLPTLPNDYRRFLSNIVYKPLYFSTISIDIAPFRKALKAQNESGNTVPIHFEPFERSYKILSEKLRPQVYKFGFLK